MSLPIPIDLAVEDDLSEAVLRKILHDRYVVGFCYKRGGCAYLKSKISGFNNASKGKPFLVLTDLDTAGCAPTLIKKWLPVPIHHNLLFRVAVREVESWVMADADRFAKFLSIPSTRVPTSVDRIDDPKEFLINLARRSRKRDIREDIVPAKGSTAKQGPNYNGCLISFIRELWQPQEAMQNSPSLERTIRAVESFQPKWDR